MTNRLLLFGATGDLAGRFLFPALAELEAAGELADGFAVTGSSRQPLDDEQFRQHVAGKLDEFAADVSAAAREKLLNRLHYARLDIGAEASAGAVRELINGRPAAVYLALPPAAFAGAVKTIAAAGLPAGSRIVLEKPFGENLQSAKALNRLLADVTGSMGEGAVFRVDHLLGMPTVHNLIGMRMANRALEASWNSAHIEKIELLWEETIALEGRAAYFDRAGALKDVMQNHVLQLLAIVAMEPSLALNEHDLRNSKVNLLRAVRPPSQEQMAARTRRARYTAGRLRSAGEAHGEEVPDYIHEKGVDARRNTETWAEFELDIDNWRWTGTRFVLRAGKALDRERKGVIVHYRAAPHNEFASHVAANELRIGIDGPHTMTLHLFGSTHGPPFEARPLVMEAELPPMDRRAYSAVFLDVLKGDCTLSVRGDEAEQQWRIVEPVLNAWAENRVPMEEYVAGSSGPRPRVTRTEVPARVEPGLSAGKLADRTTERAGKQAEE